MKKPAFSMEPFTCSYCLFYPMQSKKVREQGIWSVL